MSMLTNRQKNNQANSGASAVKQPRDRFIIGQSECYFESAQYLTGKLDATKVKALFVNPETSIEVTEGKSLKVMFHTANEVKFTGFVTAGDASLELDEEDIATIRAHATSEDITKAIDVDALVDLF